MKLQLALDRLTKEECFRIVEETEESIEIIEIGTGIIKEYGMPIVREMQECFPDKLLLTDMKTCDAGKHEATQAFRAGADITTVMAFSSNSTIKNTLQVAKDMNKSVMIDLLEVTSKKRIAELVGVGVNSVSLHIGKDKQTEGNFNTELFSLVNGFDIQVAVAGGIKLGNLPEIINENPDIIIIGSEITNSDDPKRVAADIREMITTLKK